MVDLHSPNVSLAFTCGQALLTAIPRFLPWGTVILLRAVSQGRIWRHLSRTVDETAASVLQGSVCNAQ